MNLCFVPIGDGLSMQNQKNTFTQVPMPTGPFSIEVEYKAKSSYPKVPSLSPEGTIGKNILSPVYSDEQHKTWQLLYKKHSDLMHSSAHYLCDEYKEGLAILNFPKDKIPCLSETSEKLRKKTGWQLMRVEGLVPPEKFFPLLAHKIFPCTDFIRHQDELDYTPAPDLFHDQVGHLPMIAHHHFAEYFHLFGLAGCAAQTEEQAMWFNRIYWFTTEFGLLRLPENEKKLHHPQIYGAGIASSCGEILYSMSNEVKKLPFDIDVICKTTFDIFHMQNLLFEIESFRQLEESFKEWAIKNSFLT